MIADATLANSAYSRLDKTVAGSPKPTMLRGITPRSTAYSLKSIPTSALRTGAFSGRSTAGTSEEENMRKERSIAELASSVAASGVIEPLVVRSAGAGAFEVIAGERRLSAARLLSLPEIPCVVRDCTDDEALVISLTENLQRRDLSPVEKARALQTLIADCRLTQEDVGAQVGMSQSAIAHCLRILDLPSEVQTLIHDGTLSMGHGKVLAGIPDKKRAIALALECVAETRSVRDLEALLAVRSLLPGERGAYRSPKARKTEIELPNGVFVVVKESSTASNCGRIEIPYWSEEEKSWAITVLANARHTAKNGTLGVVSGARFDARSALVRSGSPKVHCSDMRRS